MDAVILVALVAVTAVNVALTAILVRLHRGDPPAEDEADQYRRPVKLSPAERV